jgi:hypothetical protein
VQRALRLAGDPAGRCASHRSGGWGAMRGAELKGVCKVNSLSKYANNPMTCRKVVIVCFLVLLLSFAALAPGGPIENRDFSHMGPVVFWGFNAFLITLWLAGLVSVYFIWKGKRGAYWAAIIIGWLYVTVIASDLGGIFPVSPDPTGFVLGFVMIADAILALSVVFFSHKALGHI